VYIMRFSYTPDIVAG